MYCICIKRSTYYVSENHVYGVRLQNLHIAHFARIDLLLRLYEFKYCHVTKFLLEHNIFIILMSTTHTLAITKILLTDFFKKSDLIFLQLICEQYLPPNTLSSQENEVCSTELNIG